MTLIKSPAGDKELVMKSVEEEDGRPVLVSSLGVWDSRLYVRPDEAADLTRKLLRTKAGRSFTRRVLVCLLTNR